MSKGSKNESIRRFYHQWFEAMENADVVSILSLIDHEFYFKAPNQPAITDKEQLRNGLRQFHQSFTETVDWKIEDIRIFDKQAVVRLSEAVTLISKDNNDTTSLEGIHLALLTEQPDGNWKLKWDVSSLNHPPPSGK